MALRPTFKAKLRATAGAAGRMLYEKQDGYSRQLGGLLGGYSFRESFAFESTLLSMILGYLQAGLWPPI